MAATPSAYSIVLAVPKLRRSEGGGRVIGGIGVCWGRAYEHM